MPQIGFTKKQSPVFHRFNALRRAYEDANGGGRVYNPDFLTVLMDGWNFKLPHGVLLLVTLERDVILFYREWSEETLERGPVKFLNGLLVSDGVYKLVDGLILRVIDSVGELTGFSPQPVGSLMDGFLNQ